MTRLAAIVVTVLAGVALLVWNGRATEGPAPDAAGRPDQAWAALDPQARCDAAHELVTFPGRWPTVCRWRRPGESLQGQAFPPPRGPAPFDDPRVEIYVGPEQTREEVANAIAHEFGHMHHTREPAFVDRWLAARGLPPDTPSEIWTEDYAEVFATLFGPPADRWRAPTARPTAEALAVLEEEFFS